MKQISTRKAAWAVYAVLLALTTITANARTIAWYHLDEVAPGGRLTPSTAILNAVDSTKLRGAPYSVSSSTLGTDENFMPVATNEVPDSVCVYDPVGITTNRNPRSLFFARADTDKPARLGGCIQVASDSSLSLTNVTVELFVLPVYQCEKTGAGFHLCGKQSTGTGKFTYSMSLTDKGIPYVNVYDSGGTLLSNTGANKFKGSDSIMDGRWHHVAFTAESTVETEGGTETTNTVAKLYVDWKLESTVQLGIPLHYVDNAPLYIGTSLMGWYAFGGFIDEVRISDVALVPSQFLRYYDNDTDTRFLVDFEGNIDASLPFPQHVAAGAAEKFPASDGALPTTSADVPNVRIVHERMLAQVQPQLREIPAELRTGDAGDDSGVLHEVRGSGRLRWSPAVQPVDYQLEYHPGMEHRLQFRRNRAANAHRHHGEEQPGQGIRELVFRREVAPCGGHVPARGDAAGREGLRQPQARRQRLEDQRTSQLRERQLPRYRHVVHDARLHGLDRRGTHL